MCCVRCDPVLAQRVIGVFPADRLPKGLSNYPCGFIANTDDSARPGQHWVAFYLSNPGRMEFFDSYGRDPEFYGSNFMKWINGRTVNFNTRRIQGDYSNVCGLYCLFYLRQRLLGRSMDAIVGSFSFAELSYNDAYLNELMGNAYSTCFDGILYTCNQICKPLLNSVCSS